MTPKLIARIKGALRKVWYWSPARREALKKAKKGNAYKCAACGEYKVKVQVDHLFPVSDINGWDSWDNYINRLFCGELQVLCILCHKNKSVSENAIRRKNKK